MLATPHTSIDGRTFRATMGQFATGVTVVSTSVAGQVHGMTANAFMSVSLDPPLIVISIGQRARMNDLLALGQGFGISVLGADQMPLSNHFAGRPGDEPQITWVWEEDVPLLAGAVASIAAEVVAAYPAGDHTLYVGEVSYVRQQPGEPLIFHAGAYAQLEAPCTTASPSMGAPSTTSAVVRSNN